MQRRTVRGRIVAGLLAGALGLFLPTSVRAQYTADFQTNIISGVTSNWTGSYIVGSNNFADALQIQSGGILLYGRGYIGFEANASNNSVLVTGAGSAWSNLGASLYIGKSGAGNSLTISNGAAVSSLNGYLGINGSSSNNSVVVDGSDSAWHLAEELHIGHGGSGNALLIRNGGHVTTLTGIAPYNSYLGYFGGRSNNCAFVGGTGSRWTTEDIYIGGGADPSGPGNSLVLSNGGWLVNRDGYVGYGFHSTSNSVLICGPGSVWSNSGVLYLGYATSGNSLVIQDGGALYTGSSWFGYEGSSTHNTALITDLGSVWKDSSEVDIGGNEPDNTLVVSNGAAFWGSAMTVGTFSNNNVVIVTGTGSTLTLSNQLTLGNDTASGNLLVVSGGGHVLDNSGWFGGSSSNNTAVITGPGSLWSNQSLLAVGLAGAGNSLVISNGAQVLDGGWDCVGCNSEGIGNTVRVVDGGVWQCSGLRYIGESGSGNSLVIDGGAVVSESFIIGASSPTCDNSVELDNGSLVATNWSHNAVLDVRHGSLLVNGGVLQADTLIVTNPCAGLIHNGGQIVYGQLILDPNLSAVGDGIPNGWKQQYGLDPFDPALANKDVDGTGFTVLQDYITGVDPTNPAAAFRITSIVQTGSDLLVTWTMGANRTNALQAAAGDGSGGYNTNGFADIFTVTNTVGTVTNYLDSSAATNRPSRYYRVRIVP